MFEKECFTLTEQHLKLIQRMWVGWGDCEFGAPEIDPKRPYGNGDVVTDIGEILDIKPDTFEDGEPEYSEELYDELKALHKETQMALQIVLSTQSFVPGNYEQEPYSGNKWELV